MRAIIRVIHVVQSTTFWWKFLVCIAIGFTITLLIPFQSNSYPVKDNYQVELSSQVSDYPNTQADDKTDYKVNLGNSRCARKILVRLKRHMKQVNIVRATWGKGDNTYNFEWSSNSGLKTIKSFESDSSTAIKTNTVKLAQNDNCPGGVMSEVDEAAQSEGVQVTYFYAQGVNADDAPCTCENGSLQY